MEGTGQEEEVESSDTKEGARVFPLSWNEWQEQGNGRWEVESSDTICRACVFPLSWDEWRVIGSVFVSHKCRQLVSGGRSDRQGLG